MSASANRERNRRGEGAKLRADILAAATDLLERSGSEQAITLRAVAREVGISAPSIYAHFPTRAAIVDAVLAGAFADFNASLAQASRADAEPVADLRARCVAYLRFAAERPARYRVLFDRRDRVLERPSDQAVATRVEAFTTLVASVQRCIDAGVSTSADAFGAATAIWVALHGYATLRPALTAFPWPDQDAMLDRIITGLAALR
jgi:AcrR family transcriptional regulator